MLTALLLTTLTLAPTEAIPSAQEPPVKVWLNKKGDIKRGTRVKVYTRVDTDGYLLILHAEADGRIRVLFPLDPFHDNYVRGGQDFEVRGRGDREAFQVYTASGVGTIYAAFSRDPFQFGEFVRNDHWDYRLFETWRLNEGLDAEAELTALVHQMADDASYFDYDLTHYGVVEQTASSGGGTVYVGAGYGYGYGYPYGGYPYYGYGYPYYGYGGYGGPYFGFGIGWGWFGINIGWGWGYGYPYYGYGYPYYGYRYPYYGYGYYRGPYHHAAAYPYYGGGYYSGNAYYNYGVGAYVLPRYTFKGNNRAGLANGGITTWQRSRRATTSGQFATYSRYVGTASRRTAPATVQSGVRRTSAQTAGRRVAPASGAAGTSRASTAGRPSIERRSVPTSNTTGRQVQPGGWGMTDGRRTVRMPDRTQKPGATQNTGRSVQQPPNLQPRTPEGKRATRTAQPRSGTEGASGRSLSQRRQTGSGSAAATGGGKTGTRQTVQQRNVSPRRPTAQPPTQSKNSLRSTLRQITSPQRSAPRAGAAPSRATPGRPTLERRVSPTRSAPRPSPTQIRSQPTRRPSQPRVRPPSRPSTSRPQVRSSPPRPRAAPSRPSAPRARPRRP